MPHEQPWIDKDPEFALEDDTTTTIVAGTIIRHKKNQRVITDTDGKLKIINVVLDHEC